MSAAHFRLDNLCVLVDYNKLQIDGHVEDVMGVAPLKAKFESFNWHTIEIDGHNFREILKALNEAKTLKDRPTAIIANTVKGKGISFMENEAGWHGKAPDDELLKQALSELQREEDRVLQLYP